MRSNRNSHHCWCACKMVQPIWKIFTKKNIVLPYNSVTAPEDSYPTDLNRKQNKKKPPHKTST